MKTLFSVLILSFMVFSSCKEKEQPIVKNDLRAPAYPLITIDPYTSGWSFGDYLYESPVKHWTGKDFPLTGVIKVDGETFRFMGMEEIEFQPIVPSSEQGKWEGKYTTDKPRDNWFEISYDDNSWATGQGAFGTDSEPTAKTNWSSEHIWIRRTIQIDDDLKGKKVYLEHSNDDGADFYINGIKAYSTGNKCYKNAIVPLPPEVVNHLKTGENLISVYCNNWVADGLIDFGLMVEKEQTKLLEKTAVQTSAEVQATQTHYTFTCGNVDLKLTFTAPLLMTDLDLMTRPVNYISYQVTANDGKAHDVEIYFEAAPHWALNQPYQQSESEIIENEGLVFLKTGSIDQNILAKAGDDRRIDWGYFYLAAEKDNTVSTIGENHQLRTDFIAGKLNGQSKAGKNEQSSLALVRKIANTKNASGKIMLGYDDLYSIQYFGENLRPYWNRNENETIISQFQKANQEYDKLIKTCNAFDRQLMQEATEAGGKKYAELCALAYRQAISAHKLVQAPNGDLLFLSKENYSNGSIGTVDVTYPSAPLFLYYNPQLAKALLNHIFYYSESGKWKKPFPAHDIGTYPLANGQTYGGDMPVEESGNMLILTAAIARMDGNAEYAKKHWTVLTTWADYLVENGLDPDNQLCTDDFAGHFAHNTNLSVKAIMGIASYGYLADMLGEKETAGKYTDKAREMAKEWISMADDGDHFRLTFDKPGTWSQKYNLIWDKLLQYHIFPKEVADKELAYYQTKQNKYGLPLDNRENYTKADWIIWTATLADDAETFQAFIDPLYLFMNETKDRIPMSDWVFTDKPHHKGFSARSVVGGYFIKMLESKLQ